MDTQNEKRPALFGLGEKSNDTEHFIGDIYIKEIAGFEKAMLMDSVTFMAGCINYWHIGQTLFVTDGINWYQEEGKPARLLHADDIVDIPLGVKHWHGASKNSGFTYLVFEHRSKSALQWLERVAPVEYEKLHQGVENDEEKM